MVKITRVYTKTGDQGSTGLINNVRISKASARIAAIGEIEQLNAMLGWVLACVKDQTKILLLKSKLQKIQNELFDYGAALAEVNEAKQSAMIAHFQSYVTRLEQEMDEMNSHLPSLSSFILPGGSEMVARLHLARTTSRNAERALVRLHEQEPVSALMLIYINRLSDWLFICSRYVSQQLGEPEILWQPFNSN